MPTHIAYGYATVRRPPVGGRSARFRRGASQLCHLPNGATASAVHRRRRRQVGARRIRDKMRYRLQRPTARWHRERRIFLHLRAARTHSPPSAPIPASHFCLRARCTFFASMLGGGGAGCEPNGFEWHHFRPIRFLIKVVRCFENRF
jgi:hypothetical protein